MTRLEELTRCIKELSADAVSTLLDVAKILLESQDTAGIPDCPYCSSTKVIRDGHKCGKQRFRCKQCGRTFVTTTRMTFNNAGGRVCPFLGCPRRMRYYEWTQDSGRWSNTKSQLP